MIRNISLFYTHYRNNKRPQLFWSEPNYREQKFNKYTQTGTKRYKDLDNSPYLRFKNQILICM